MAALITIILEDSFKRQEDHTVQHRDSCICGKRHSQLCLAILYISGRLLYFGEQNTVMVHINVYSELSEMRGSLSF
ncbi:hypothetical protein SERLA73DRAFT_183653 [Serpula lacrymans var. lacrymans S7.3]|uniref:Uncharacterized protein n=2 Tax=Serpula lacrymans var. lacrymans TaxID=341189 RepID=F8Q0D2_SERL3|nr:uncharacterized protein SERLADRAFT_470952 [Serpula lacrymans var. lacrymans S7.9]EGN98582.1 hypothetical protein SERLA73DRAFT_183653 [Serpula lacrymans var. lacrymans S7.3]EGO24147.1 hypothetical protein SERLADRAFT_470952 [Serpula lacrymans var. lacrymans S7.9]